MSILNIPEKYWLKIENFNINTFSYDDFRIIELLSNDLIIDFKKVHKNYDIIKEEKRKNYIKENKKIIKCKKDSPNIVGLSPNIFDVDESPDTCLSCNDKIVNNNINNIKRNICNFTKNLLNAHIRN
jgi:hypothetical protein